MSWKGDREDGTPQNLHAASAYLLILIKTNVVLFIYSAYAVQTPIVQVKYLRYAASVKKGMNLCILLPMTMLQNHLICMRNSKMHVTLSVSCTFVFTYI